MKLVRLEMKLEIGCMSIKLMSKSNNMSQVAIGMVVEAIKNVEINERRENFKWLF